MSKSPSSKGAMAWRGRLETWASLAMLPVGVALATVSALASITLVFVALVWTIWAMAVPESRIGVGVLALWCWVGGIAGAYNTVTAIEALSGLDWRPMLRVALLTGLVALLYPGIWAIVWG